LFKNPQSSTLWIGGKKRHQGTHEQLWATAQEKGGGDGFPNREEYAGGGGVEKGDVYDRIYKEKKGGPRSTLGKKGVFFALGGPRYVRGKKKIVKRGREHREKNAKDERGGGGRWTSPQRMAEGGDLVLMGKFGSGCG